MDFLQKLIGGFTNHQSSTTQPSSALHGLLGYRAGAVDMPSKPLYQPKSTYTPAFSLPQPNLQRYGNPQGQQWFENTQGQHFQVPQAPQAFDAPIANRPQQFLRPGINGAFPTSDATLHGVPQPKPIGRII